MNDITKLVGSFTKYFDANRIKARELAESQDHEGIRKTATNLWNCKKRVRENAIEVLVEIGLIQPDYIAPYVSGFIELLSYGDATMTEGAMQALATIAALKPAEIAGSLDVIQKAMKAGSEIADLYGVMVLAGVASIRKEYVAPVNAFLIDNLQRPRSKKTAQMVQDVTAQINAMNILTQYNNQHLGEKLRAVEEKLGDLEKTIIEREQK